MRRIDKIKINYFTEDKKIPEITLIT